jgi:hypothetical protein
MNERLTTTEHRNSKPLAASAAVMLGAKSGVAKQLS